MRSSPAALGQGSELAGGQESSLGRTGNLSSHKGMIDLRERVELLGNYRRMRRAGTLSWPR